MSRERPAGLPESGQGCWDGRVLGWERVLDWGGRSRVADYRLKCFHLLNLLSAGGATHHKRSTGSVNLVTFYWHLIKYFPWILRDRNRIWKILNKLEMNKLYQVH